MPTLVLPPRYTPDSNALAMAAGRAGWGVERLAGWRVPEGLRDRDPVLYGEPLFADVVAGALGLVLIDVPPDWLIAVPPCYLRRNICQMTLANARGCPGPAFVKPAADKSFPAAVYPSGTLLPEATHLLPDDTPVLLAEPVHWECEFRTFVLDRAVATLSPYLRDGQLARNGDGRWSAPTEQVEEAEAFAAAVLADPAVRLPAAVVLDVGRIRGRGWAVVEANAAWGSGLYGCAAERALPVLARASVRRNAVTPDDQPWIRTVEVEDTN